MAYVSMADLQEQRNQMIADRQQKAHDRFVQRRTNFIESNPNAVSASERENYLGRRRRLEDENRMRNAELERITTKGAADLAIEEQKKLGMIGQGSEAAKANAEAAKYRADKDSEVALRNAEVAAANGRAQFGSMGEDGVYHAGSNVEQAKAQSASAIEAAKIKAEADKYAADANVDVQSEKNAGIQATVDSQRDLETFKHEHAKELAEIRATKGVNINQAVLRMLMLEQQELKKKGQEVTLPDLYQRHFGRDAE